MFTAGEIFSIAVRIEENGENFYREAQKHTSEPSLRELLEWLAEEEAQHKGYFLNIKGSLSEFKESDWPAEVGETILQSMVKDRPLSLEEVEISSIRSVDELIQIGLGLEQDSIKFYEFLIAFIENPETLKSIQQILDEERKHVRYLREHMSSES